MRHVICVGMLLTGCMYWDPVNYKPRLYQVECTVVGPMNAECPAFVGRGTLLRVSVPFQDQDGDPKRASFDWRAFFCRDKETQDCDESPFDEQTTTTADFEVPSDLMDVRAIRVDVQLRDERGALAEQSSSFKINDPPVLKVRQSAHSYVVGGPVDLFANYTDLDDGPDGVDLRFDIVAPQPSAVALTKLDVDPDFTGKTINAGRRLVPDSTGNWNVVVTATDMNLATTQMPLPFTIGPDQPPCLAQSTPVVPPAGASLPLSDPTLFQVALVNDDLDPYPPLSNDSHFGTPAFEWSILPPGSPGWQRIAGADGNTVDFDPAAFTPGDLVELRVEIFDRNNTRLPCAADEATCSVSTQASCFQRQTWRVEVR